MLEALWPADPAAHFFPPAAAIEARQAERSAARRTPRYPSHMKRDRAKRVKGPKRPPVVCYTSCSFARAVRTAIDKLNAGSETVMPWRPNMLRQLYGTLARRRFGLEAAGASLGHSKMSAAEVYAERVAAEVG